MWWAVSEEVACGQEIVGFKKFEQSNIVFYSTLRLPSVRGASEERERWPLSGGHP